LACERWRQVAAPARGFMSLIFMTATARKKQAMIFGAI
jgi:hypothetical protein